MENTMIVNNDAAYELTQPVPFGKYKGQPMSVLAADLNYCQWLMAQDWFSKSQPTVYNLIVNNFVKPEDTPEHNGFQARFLDKEYVKKFCKAVFPEDALMKAFYTRKEAMQEYNFRNECRANANEIVDAFKKEIIEIDNLCSCFDYDAYLVENVDVHDVLFEQFGWDVVFDIRYCCSEEFGEFLCVEDFLLFPTVDIRRSSWFQVEVKPCVGDDYPSILRQMQAQVKRAPGKAINILVYDRFTGSGVTEDQMRGIFRANGFKVVRFDEIDAA